MGKKGSRAPSPAGPQQVGKKSSKVALSSSFAGASGQWPGDGREWGLLRFGNRMCVEKGFSAVLTFFIE